MEYKEIAAINVNGHVEKKNNLSYLSWAWAADQLMRLDPAAEWEYLEPKTFGDTMMVFCKVTAFGKTRTAQLPVMDYKNKAIANPDAFQVNTAMQRCLAKAIALHGLGLYIYAGEDLPPDTDPPEEPEKPAKAPLDARPTSGAWDNMDGDQQKRLESIAMDVIIYLSKGRDIDAYERLHDEELDADEKVALWTRFDSKQRAALTKAGKVKETA